MCFLSFPSIACNSSVVSCSRLAGIGGGGIEKGAIKGGKKGNGGMGAFVGFVPGIKGFGTLVEDVEA